MLDLAKLGIEIDSSDAAGASNDLDKFSKSAGRAEGEAKRLSATGRILSSSLAQVAKFAGGLAAAFLSFQTVVSSFTAAREFNAALAETSTLIEGTEREMSYLEDRARSMAKAFGTTATSQVEAFYQALSAGAGSVENANTILDAANKFAIGGVTDVKVGVDALTNAVNAYSRSGLTAAEASDALFVGIKAGKTTADELASSLGQVIPISSAVGVSFDETVAAVAALTTQGQSTAQAVTGVRGALAAVLKPTSQATELAKALGLEFSLQSLKAKGLAGFLQDVTDKTKGNQQAMATLFSGIEGLNAVLALTSGGAEKFAETLELMGDKAGATEEAFQKINAELDQRLKNALSTISDGFIAFGQVLLQVAVPAMEGLIKVGQFLHDNLNLILVAITALAATQIPLLVGSMATMLIGMNAASIAAGAFALAMRGVGVAMALAGGPLGIFLGLLAGGAAYFLLFRDNAGLAEQAAYDAAAGTEALNSALGYFHQTSAPSAGKAAIDLANDNIKLANSAYEAAKAELAKRHAILESSAAAYDAVSSSDPEAALILGEDQVQAVKAYREQVELVRKAEEALARTRAEQKNAVTAVTGASYTPSTAPADMVGDSVQSVLDQIGVGGGGSVGREMDDRLETLMDKLQTEREALEKWRQEGVDTLNEAYEQERITKTEHDDAMLRLNQEYQDRLREMNMNGLAGQLGQASAFFDDLAQLSQSRNKTLLKISQTFAAAQALINTYLAASQTLADPTLSFWAKFAAVAKVIAAGLGLVNAIKSGGKAASSSSTSSSRDRDAGRPTGGGVRNPKPQRVIIEGIGPDTLVSGAVMQSIFDQFYDLNKDRGTVFQIARA